MITKVNPKYITFTADENNRQSLYNRLILVMGGYIKNYKKLDINPITNEKTNTEEFWLIKKENIL